KDRIKIKNEVRILTSSGRTSGLIIGLLPVFIILVLMLINPEYFHSFFDSQPGKLMMALSVVLEATGFAVINKIVNIKY
ncbi:MAG: type II secretion system F family protein, partial [Oscillospiraceae bacterium]